MLPEVIARGKLRYDTVRVNKRSAVLDHKGYKTVFRLDKHGDRQTWVLTHFFNEKGRNLLE